MGYTVHDMVDRVICIGDKYFQVNLCISMPLLDRNETKYILLLNCWVSGPIYQPKLTFSKSEFDRKAESSNFIIFSYNDMTSSTKQHFIDAMNDTLSKARIYPISLLNKIHEPLFESLYGD